MISVKLNKKRSRLKGVIRLKHKSLITPVVSLKEAALLDLDRGF